MNSFVKQSILQLIILIWIKIMSNLPIFCSIEQIFFLKYSISEKLNILPSMIEGFELQWLSPLVLPKKFY